MSLKHWAVSLTLAFTLATSGCRHKEPESTPYRDPQIITDLVDNAILAADTSTVSAAGGNDFHWRMVHILRACDTRDLQVLKKHNVTIALDQRLPASNNVTFFYPTVEAAFYQTDSSKTLTLWDDGKGECQDNAYYISKMPEIVHNLALMLEDNKVPQETIYCGRFKDANRDSRMEWRTEENFSKKALKKNPLLRLPPNAPVPAVPTVEKKKDKPLRESLAELKQVFADLKKHKKAHSNDKVKQTADTLPPTAPRTDKTPRVRTPHEKIDLQPELQELKKNAAEFKQQTQKLKDAIQTRKAENKARKELRKKNKEAQQNAGTSCSTPK